MKRLLAIWVPDTVANEVMEAFLHGEPPAVNLLDNQIPSDAKLEGWSWFPDRRAFLAVFEHESFRPHVSGNAIEIADARWSWIKPEAFQVA